MGNYFCKPKLKVGTEWVMKGSTCAQAAASVSGIARAIYERTFRLVVEKCNETLIDLSAVMDSCPYQQDQTYQVCPSMSTIQPAQIFNLCLTLFVMSSLYFSESAVGSTLANHQGNTAGSFGHSPYAWNTLACNQGAD